MKATPLGRMRLPCAGLFLAALAGIAIARWAEPPAPALLAAFALCSMAACSERWRAAIWPATACAFALLQTWQFRESASARLAGALTDSWQTARAVIEVDSIPAPAGTETSRFRARLLELETDGRTVAPACLVEVRWRADPPAPGDRFAVTAAIRNVPPARNPGEIDPAAWLGVRGIRSELRVERGADAERVGRGFRPLLSLAAACRGWIERTLSLSIDGTPELALIRGMTLGDISGTPEWVRAQFRETGTFHLFSVSGLHVGMIALLLWFTLSVAGVDARRIVWVLIPCLFLYALVTGLKPASVRAATMVSIAAAALLFDRNPVPLNSVGAAGLAILAFNSNELFNPGFQLSFSVVATILVVAVPIHRQFVRILEPDPFIPRALLSDVHRRVLGLARGASGLLAVCVAAWVGSLPLTLYYFHLVSWIAIPVNLVAVPMAFCVLALAMLSLGTGWIVPLAAELFNNANWLVARFLLGGIGWAASVPGAFVYIGPPLPRDVAAEITVFDFGSGGAAAVRTHDSVWLIDTGNAFRATSTVAPFLRSRGASAIGGILATHGDSGHIGGVIPLAESFRVSRLLLPSVTDRSPTRRRIGEFARISGLRVERVSAGDRFSVGDGVALEILFPPEGFARARADDKAVVAAISSRDTRILFLSDAGLAAENWLLENVPDSIRCDIVVAGRHDTGHHAQLAFLERTGALAIVVTAADFPSSERLDPSWAAQVAARGIRIFRLSETGAVALDLGAKPVGISTFLDPAAAAPE